MFAIYNTTSKSKSLANISLKRHKNTDMRFKTVIPSLLRIAKKCRRWKYNFKFWKSALSKKLGGKYALDSKIIWSSAYATIGKIQIKRRNVFRTGEILNSHRNNSLPEKLFYPVVHRTTKMAIFTSPATFLVVLLQKFGSFSRYIMDMHNCRTHGLNEPKFISHFVLNVVYLIL